MLSLRYTLPSFSSIRVALRTLARAALLIDLVDVSGDCGDLRLDLVDEFCHDCI